MSEETDRGPDPVELCIQMRGTSPKQVNACIQLGGWKEASIRRYTEQRPGGGVREQATQIPKKEHCKRGNSRCKGQTGTRLAGGGRGRGPGWLRWTQQG